MGLKNTVRIRVEKCSNQSYWYRRYIGEVFNATPHGDFYTIFGEGKSLLRKDCSEITLFGAPKRIKKLWS